MLRTCQEEEEIISETNNMNKNNIETSSHSRKLTRQLKRKYEQMSLQKLSEIDPKFLALEKEREEITKIRIIETIVMGPFEIGTWYFSPFPDEYGNCKKLFLCEGCLKYMKLEESYRKHQVIILCKRIYL